MAGPIGGDGAPTSPYRVVDTRARARAGIAYLVMAVVAASITMVTGIVALWLTAVAVIAAIALFHIGTAWAMPVKDVEAIAIAADAASFDVGHGSATLGYHGVLARPVWQVFVYADTPSPDHQAVVTVDAMTGAVTGRYEEPVDLP